MQKGFAKRICKKDLQKEKKEGAQNIGRLKSVRQYFYNVQGFFLFRRGSKMCMAFHLFNIYQKDTELVKNNSESFWL